MEPLRLPDLFTAESREGNPLSWLLSSSDNPVSVRHFRRFDEWREYVVSLFPAGNAPGPLLRNHERVLRTLYLAWIDESVIKLAELGALANLEAAIKERYRSESFRGLEEALRYLLDQMDARNPEYANFIKGASGPALSEIRNRLAHGNPFETLPYAGLFEAVRDLIDLMYPAS